ncbi:MAG: TonB-dependent receptor [candidate division WOR-3 bacterium]|nr:MAG: TonB-dependent receptor [candidate division WOR-3 bacterium]
MKYSSTSRSSAVLVAVFTAAGFALAGVTGSVDGKVTEKGTGEVLAGASVVLIQQDNPTDYGTATDAIGRYQIINVPAGYYDVECSFMGYVTEKVTGVLVIQDQSVTVDFKLGTEIIESGTEVNIVAKKVDLVRIEEPFTQRIITDDEFKRLPVDQLSDIVGLQAGVSQTTTGWTHIRGGRYDDVAYFVDGVAAQDAVYGTLWSSPRPTTDALQSVVVLTGGFDAEYGSAMSGVIKAVTKEGGSKTSGRLRYYTDEMFPDPDLNFGYNRASFSIGGPLVDKLRYFVSAELFKTDDDRNIQYQVHAPRGEYTGEGKLTYTMPKSFPLTREGLKFTFDGHHSNYQWQSFANSYKYLQEALYANRVRSTKANFTINHMLNETTVYEAKVGMFSTALMRAVRNYSAEAADTTGFWGFLRGAGIWDRYFFRAEDWVFDWEKYRAEQLENDDPDPITDQEDAVLKLYRSYWLDADGNRVYAHRFDRNFLQTNTVTINNPHGVYEGLFVGEGDTRSWHYRATDHLLGKFDFTKTLNKVHEIKTGVQLTSYTISVYENSLPWDPNPFWDAYSYDPLVAAVYLQDKADFEDLVVRAGLRFDYLDSKAEVRVFPESLGSSPEIADSLVIVDPKYRFSPRLGLSYPITERVKFRFSYGHFFKNPSFNDLFSYADRTAAELRSRGNIVVGNADMAAEKTIAYELGFDAQLTDIFAFDLTMFYKDVFDLSGLRPVQALPQPYTMYYNVEYARIQGFEATMTKVLDQYWSLRAGYTFQIARGTASTAFDQYMRSTPLQVDYYLDQDQRHSVNADLTFALPGEFTFVPLRDFDIATVFTYGSGGPYTRQDDRGDRIGKENEYRMPDSYNVDMRIAKDFRFAGMGLAVNCDISNLLGNENILYVHPTTGEPDRTGREPKPTQFGGGLAVGDPYYHSNRDYNHDGYMTRSEAYASYMIAYRDRNDSPSNYAAGRKVRFGVTLSF